MCIRDSITNASVNESTGLYEVRGVAWGQAGSVSAVEVRIDGGSWMQATYEVVEGGLGALERFDWMVAYDMDLLSKGNHTLEVRGLNEQGVSSLPVFVTFSGTGEGMDGAGGLDADLLFLAGAVLLLGLLVMFALGGRIDPPLSLASAANEPDAAAVDAVLVEEEPKKSGKGSKT